MESANKWTFAKKNVEELASTYGYTSKSIKGAFGEECFLYRRIGPIVNIICTKADPINKCYVVESGNIKNNLGENELDYIIRFKSLENREVLEVAPEIGPLVAGVVSVMR